MAQILIRAVDRVDVDPEKDRLLWKKGCPVVILPDGHIWGTKEGPPDFVAIHCADFTPAQILHYLNAWRDDYSYTVVDTTPAQGLYVIQVTNNAASTSGVNGLTVDRVNAYLNRWGCSNLSLVSANVVQFEMRLWQVLQSNGFWDADVSAFTFVLNSYDAGTGVGDVTVTLPDQNLVPRATARIVERGGTVGTITVTPAVTVQFTINRSDLFEKFKIDTMKNLQKVYYRTRYYFLSALVDQALLLPNGIMTMTGTELLAAVHDRLAE